MFEYTDKVDEMIAMRNMMSKMYTAWERGRQWSAAALAQHHIRNDSTLSGTQSSNQVFKAPVL